MYTKMQVRRYLFGKKYYSIFVDKIVNEMHNNASGNRIILSDVLDFEANASKYKNIRYLYKPTCTLRNKIK